MEQEESVVVQQTVGGTLDRKSGVTGKRTNTSVGQRGINEKTANGTSIVHQPLPDPPTLASQPLSAAHFTQYRSPAPPTLPCCNQSNQQYRSQNRSGRTPEKFFSTSTQQQIRPGMDQSRGISRPSYSHTLDRRYAHANQNSQSNQNVQGVKTGSQTLDRRRQNPNMRVTSLAPLDAQQSSHDPNKDMYAVTEL